MIDSTPPPGYSWPASIGLTKLLSSQGDPQDLESTESFDEVINSHLKMGWRIVASYVEHKGAESTCEECFVLLGRECDP